MNTLDKLDNLHTGTYGILEPKIKVPANLKEIELILVPGIVFDYHGNRIGFGYGYYDKLLSKIPAPKIALSFGFQIKESIPHEKFDIKMDFLVSEEKVYDCIPHHDNNKIYKLKIRYDRIEESRY